MTEDEAQNLVDDCPIAAEALIISQQIGMNFLHGIGCELQSAVLANLTALWLAGHIAETPADTKKLRKMLLTAHMKLVKDLIEPSEREILDKLVDRSAPQ